MLLTEVDVVLAGHPREGDVLRVEGVAVTRSLEPVQPLLPAGPVQATGQVVQRITQSEVH